MIALRRALRFDRLPTAPAIQPRFRNRRYFRSNSIREGFFLALRWSLAPMVVIVVAGCDRDPNSIHTPAPCVLVVAIAPDPVSVRVDGEATLSLDACGFRGNVSWTSSDTSIATVMATTPPHAVARGKRPGTAVITATLQIDPGVRDAVTLTVIP